jgi:ribonuclease BN (tRNA processing enzyme)
LLDEEILIDAGTGVGDLSLAEMSRVHRVFLTHAHLDHVCGLAFMADNLFGQVRHPIEVVATPQTIGAIRSHLFNWELWPDFSELPDKDNALLRMRESAIGEVHDLGSGRSIQSFEVLHTVPAVGYVIRSERGVFAFTGDTGAYDPMWDFLNALPRLDKLMIDIAFPDELAALGKISRHYTPSVLGGDLARLRHRPELLLTHHKPGCEGSLHDECKSALEGWNYVHLRRGTVIEL